MVPFDVSSLEKVSQFFDKYEELVGILSTRLYEKKEQIDSCASAKSQVAGKVEEEMQRNAFIRLLTVNSEFLNTVLRCLCK